ncbi:MAG TPA: sugar phosphate isomerase/epimerase family protein [Ktedonobacteraceae bacterium]|nr:sugar phosphate isomerase/epimerase family protein [Ktedonobacteraceae bacterium]
MNRPMQLLCSTGTFSRFPDLTDYRSILTYGPELEVDGLELMFYPDWSSEIEQIATALIQSQLRFPAIHAEKGIAPALTSSRPGEPEQGWQWMQASCRLAKSLGANLLIFHLWGYPNYDENIEKNLQLLNDCMKIAEEFGLQLVIETVPCKYNDPLSNILRAVEQEPNVLVALDTEFLEMHNQLEAALEADWLWQYNRVRHIHIKDYDGNLYSTGNFRRYLHPGEGSINFRKFFDLLKLHSFKGNISLESSVVNQDGSRDIHKLKQNLSMLHGMLHIF